MISNRGYAALHRGAALLDRRERGRLRLTGADRRSYLQGLLTNDIVALTQGHGCYAALLTPQGRMLSDMRVSELGDAVLIDLPSATAEAVRARLSDFIFSEDVDVQDAQPTLAQLGLYGPQAAVVLAAASGEGDALRARLESLALNHNMSLTIAGAPVVVVGSDDYGSDGFEIFPGVERALEVEGALRQAGAVAVDPETVDVTRVEAGRPAFGADMDERTIPLEAGIEERAISLTKGCYVGQEVIIRVLHRGQGRVARHLVGLIGDVGDPVPAAGARVDAANLIREPSADAVAGKAVGAVTSAVHSPRLGGPIALAYVHRDYVEPGRLLAVDVAGGYHQVRVSRLPFDLPAPSTAEQ